MVPWLFLVLLLCALLRQTFPAFGAEDEGTVENFCLAVWASARVVRGRIRESFRGWPRGLGHLGVIAFQNTGVFFTFRPGIDLHRPHCREGVSGLQGSSKSQEGIQGVPAHFFVLFPLL